MMPGDRVTGRVKIGNGSRVRARFFLGLSKLVETPGQGGGRLSYRLVLTVKGLPRGGGRSSCTPGRCARCRS